MNIQEVEEVIDSMTQTELTSAWLVYSESLNETKADAKRGAEYLGVDAPEDNLALFTVVIRIKKDIDQMLAQAEFLKNAFGMDDTDIDGLVNNSRNALRIAELIVDNDPYNNENKEKIKDILVPRLDIDQINYTEKMFHVLKARDN